MNSFLANLLASLSALFIFLTCISFSKWRDLSKERKLRDLVAWSVTTNYRSIESVRPGLDLIDYVGNVEYEKNLSKKYSIDGNEETSIAKDILKEFQRVLTQEYFNGKLSLPKTKYADGGEHFFFAHLFVFLRKHECDYDFIGNAMHTQRLRHKQYGQSFSSGSESTYQLSAFGVVFHKLYYISYLFCRDSCIYGERMPDWITEKGFTDILDSGEITICLEPY